MTDPTKAKIIELVPEIVEQPFEGHAIYTSRSITLADVLRAIAGSNDPQWAIYSSGEFMKWGDTPARIHWNLSNDYDGQMQEVKEFIGKLLGV